MFSSLSHCAPPDSTPGVIPYLHSPSHILFLAVVKPSLSDLATWLEFSCVLVYVAWENTTDWEAHKQWKAIPPSSGIWKSKIKVLDGLLSGEDFFLCSQLMFSSHLPSVHGAISTSQSLFYKVPNLLLKDSILTTQELPPRVAISWYHQLGG